MYFMRFYDTFVWMVPMLKSYRNRIEILRQISIPHVPWIWKMWCLSLPYKPTCQGREIWKLKLNDLWQTLVISVSFNCGELDFLLPMLQCSRTKLYWLVGSLAMFYFTDTHFLWMARFECIWLISQSRINDRISTKEGIVYGQFNGQRNIDVTYIGLWKIMKLNLSYVENRDLHPKGKILGKEERHQRNTWKPKTIKNVKFRWTHLEILCTL
jgi:hypothetical protein